ncbi:PAS domain S-box protein, partial [bacterium]|nr:PAS domain S-box protein [bacterium]
MNNAAGRLYGESALRETLPILGKILVVVLMCEAVVTVILYLLLPLSLWHVIIDPIFLGVLMTPQVYRFVVRPIRRAAEQRKLAEEARLLEQKYESLIKNIPVAVYSAMPDERGTTTFMADRWKEWTGYSPEDLYRDCSTWPRSIHPDDKNKAIESYIKAWKERREYVSEYRVVHKDTGEVRYLRDHGVPIKDETGNIIRIEGIAIDITERVRAEEEIRDLARFPSEDPAPVLRIAADGTVLYANKTAEPLLAAKGSGANQAAPPEWRELVASVLVSGTRQVTEVEHGEQIFAISVVPLPEAGYVNLYGADITERKRAEYLLKNFTEGLLGNVPAIVITLDNQLRVKQFNKFAEELTGYTEEEVLGGNWIDMFIAPEERQRVMDAARKGFTGKALSGFENHILAKDRHKILMQWYVSSLGDDRGNIVGTLG